MKINSENIDECFFDYFEGNLKEDEKLKLMNFIHLHPEYEKDFAIWAQSYTLKDESLKDYGLAPGLINHNKSSITKLLYVLIPAIILLSCYFLIQTPTKEFIPQKIQDKSIPDRSEETYISKPDIKTSTIPKKNRSSIGENKNILSEPILFPSGIDTNLISEEEHVSKNNLSPVSDTIAKTVSPDAVTPAAKEKEPVPNKRKKRLFNLKPSPEFIPVNENF